MTEDRWPVRVVVGSLAAVVVLGLLAEAFLAFTHAPIPDQLDRLVSIALGAVAGILSRTSRPDPAEPQAVTIDTETTGPVPVDTEPEGPPPAGAGVPAPPSPSTGPTPAAVDISYGAGLITTTSATGATPARVRPLRAR